MSHAAHSQEVIRIDLRVQRIADIREVILMWSLTDKVVESLLLRFPIRDIERSLQVCALVDISSVSSDRGRRLAVIIVCDK